MPTIETTILDTMNYLQALNRTLINAPAVASYPTVLDTPNLPMAITWPGAGDWWLKGGGWGQSNRTYRVIVFIQVLNQDDIPSRAVDSAGLLGRFLNLYLVPGNAALANPLPFQLSLQSAPDGIHHSDNGLVPSQSFGGRNFVGFELAVRVRSEWIPG
jgi:hypothetical protein